MDFLEIYGVGAAAILGFMTALWIASLADPMWCQITC